MSKNRCGLNHNVTVSNKIFICLQDMKRLKTLIPKLAFVTQNGSLASGSNNDQLNPYVDANIGVISRNRQKSINGGESVKSHGSSNNSIGRLRAATMMKQTKVPTKKIKPEVVAGHSSIFANARKGSYDVGSRNVVAGNISTHQPKQGRDSSLSIQDNSFHLPNLGRTVSHSMTPANVSVRKVNNSLIRPTEEDDHNDDPKLVDLVAKS